MFVCYTICRAQPVSHRSSSPGRGDFVNPTQVFINKIVQIASSYIIFEKATHITSDGRCDDRIQCGWWRWCLLFLVCHNLNGSAPLNQFIPSCFFFSPFRKISLFLKSYGCTIPLDSTSDPGMMRNNVLENEYASGNDLATAQEQN